MSKEKISLTPSEIYKPFGKYSHGILNKKSGLLISSGQLGITKEGQIPEKFIDQTKLCFANILSILKEANFSLDDILKVSAFVTDRKYFKDYMIIRDQFLKNVIIKPTSTLLIVSGFTKPEFLVEIEIIAQKIHS